MGSVTHGSGIELSSLPCRSNNKPSTRQRMRILRVPQPKVRNDWAENDWEFTEFNKKY